jgi:endonuclease III
MQGHTRTRTVKEHEMSKQNNASQFELIVRTLLSNQNTDPRIIREHVQKYAQDNGLSYDLARQAITLVVKDRITRKLEQL